MSNNNHTGQGTEVTYLPGMTKEELIRVRIIPQLNSITNNLWDTGDYHNGRRLDSIIDELTNILNGIDDV